MLRGGNIEAPLLSREEINGLIQSAQSLQITKGKHKPEHGRAGEVLSSTIGSGSDFAEVSAYHAGDDTSRIDWRATARSQVPLVRTYHAEYTSPVCIMIDRRAGMRFGSKVRLKVTQAVRLAIWMAAKEIHAGKELSFFLLDEPCQWIPAQSGQHAIDVLVEYANTACPPVEPEVNGEQWSNILASMHQKLPRASELVLLSDFSGFKIEDKLMLEAIGRYCNTHAIHILDPIESVLPEISHLELRWGKHTRQAAVHSQHHIERWQKDLMDMMKHANVSYQKIFSDRDNFSEFLNHG